MVCPAVGDQEREDRVGLPFTITGAEYPSYSGRIIQTMPFICGRAGTWSRSERTVPWLLAANMAVALGMVYIIWGKWLGDTSSYLGLAEGILHGNYSMWWELPGSYPDTFRTPGFPLFIAVIMQVFGTWKAVIAVNFVIYGLGLLLTLRTIKTIDPRPQARNLFLLLLLPLLNVPFYIGQVYPEIPSLFAISAVLYMLSGKGPVGIGRALVLGLLYGFIFQSKPIFLLFPFLVPVAGWLVERHGFAFRGHLIAAGIFVLTLLPYGIWNSAHHGVFSVTPLEGGAGVMHFGVWAGKIPGYTEKVYWHNFTGDELVRFTPVDSIPAHVRAYEQEWVMVNHELSPLLTAADSLMLASGQLMTHNPSPTYNTAYTLERERLLRELAIDDALKWPGYILAYKSYSAVRLWVIGVQRADFFKASLPKKVELLYGPLSTGVVFLMFIVFVPIAYFRGGIKLRDTWLFLLFLGYFGVMHIPFVIQARYTTPVRFAMLAVLSLALVSFKAKADPAGNTGAAPGKRR